MKKGRKRYEKQLLADENEMIWVWGTFLVKAELQFILDNRAPYNFVPAHSSWLKRFMRYGPHFLLIKNVKNTQIRAQSGYSGIPGNIINK